MTLEDAIRNHALARPDHPAIVSEGKSCTYGQLRQMVEISSARLEGAGRAVPLKARHGTDFLADYFAVHLSGRVAVPLEPDTRQEAWDDVCRILESSAIPEGVADILFTTGTTGKRKGVMISHAAISADTDNLISAQGYTSDTAFIVNGPLSHIGSLSKVWATVMAGGTVVLVDGLRDMSLFFDTIASAEGKVATFLVPASIRMILAFATDRLKACADKIDFIETGAAPMTASDMRRLKEILPGTRLFNTYASTETGIIATYDYNAGRAEAGLLGRAMRNSRMEITAGGLVACGGATLMSGYVGDGELTREVLSGGMVLTGDLGYIDSDGLLHLTGRDDDIINVGGFKVSPVEVEDAAMRMPGIDDCICVPVAHKILGRALKLLYVAHEGTRADSRSVASFLKERLDSHKVPVMYGEVDSIRRTFNGKPDRKAYLED